MAEADSIKQMVLQRGDEIKRLVDNEVSQLVSEVETVKSSIAKQAQAVQDRLQPIVVAMESFDTSSQELLDKGRPSDVTRQK